MFDIGNSSISQDQTLALQSQVLAYVREALTYDKGYCVLAVKDLGSFEFEYYYSDGSNIEARPDETRLETIDRILITLSCSELKNIKNGTANINDVIRFVYNYIVGILSSNFLAEKYKILDHSNLIRENSAVE